MNILLSQVAEVEVEAEEDLEQGGKATSEQIAHALGLREFEQQGDPYSRDILLRWKQDE